MSSCNFAVRLLFLLIVCATLPVSVLMVERQAGAEDATANKPSVVKVVEENGAFHLTKNGQPFFIKGVGGNGSRQLLRDMGGNSFRTWGADDLGPQLDEAQKLGLSVTVGIWLGHKEQGFDYNNADQVAEQYEKARKAILKYKDHPALLMWGLGNEMEGYVKGDNAAIWSAVNNIAALAKKLDPNHPTMTVIAEIGGDKVKNINRLCPDIDIVGINSYGGGPSLAARYKQAGGVKPYVVTEYGPPGVWETGKNDWGAVPEPTSTAKATFYRKTYEQAIINQKQSLGGYAFIWDHKQEATATWFGLMLPDGSRLGGIDALNELWTGKPPAHPCPVLRNLKINGPDQVEAGATVKAALDAAAPDGQSLQVKWVLQSDQAKMNSNGEAEAAPPTYPDAITQADSGQAVLHMPRFKGGYRLFAYVRDTHGGAAVANVPIFVRGGDAVPLAAAKPAKLPLVIYDEAGHAGLTYAPSGYMGNTGAIKMQEDWAQSPHSGKTCLRVEYQAKDSWGGVVWQSPANDWGDKPGGSSLTGASKVTFWARGDKGGEVVTFLCGLIGRDKPYFDTVQAKLDRATLTKEWKQYSIDLKGKDLSCVKTGFGWTLAASGEPVTFYLDDVRFE